MRTGSEIEAICGRCGTVWHVVIALAGGKIAQVECTQCHARHRYRPKPGAAAASRAAASGRANAGAARSATGAAPRRSSRKPAKPIVLADPARPARPFDTSETYQVGDRVVHASFGEGVVQAVLGARKIEILFEDGKKTLVHARSAG